MQEVKTAKRRRESRIDSQWNASSRLAAVAVALFTLFAALLFEYSRAVAFDDRAKIEPTRDAIGTPPCVNPPDYWKFDHACPKEHKELMAKDKCGSCHRRNDATPHPNFPLHKDCTGCHMVQFTQANNSSSVNPICTNCHNGETLNSRPTPLKPFSRLVDFTAEFDHAQHLQGISEARPPNGCLACHNPANRGVAESIPTSLRAHEVCYKCHSPGKEATKTSSCGYCHSLGSHSSTSTAARSYRMGFSHADHSVRARLNCDRCHDIRGRGLPQTKQVSSITPIQHLPNARGCISCHNGQRSFGEQVKGNFENCRRCHKGEKFGS